MNAGEMIFAGGDDSFGTLSQPYTLKWMPNECGPLPLPPPSSLFRLGLPIQSVPNAATCRCHVD